jgi:hypothetical protein
MRRSAFATAAAPASIASNSVNEAFSPFIFQLPAISGRIASVMTSTSQISDKSVCTAHEWIPSSRPQDAD